MPELSVKIDTSGLNSVFGVGMLHRSSLGFDKTTTVFVSFNPIKAISYSGTFTITSNDPTHPSLKVLLSGTGA